MTRTTRDVLAGFLVAVCVLGFALEFGGGAPEPAPAGLPDSGLFVGWALPIVTLISEVAAVMVIGLVVLGVFLLPANGPELEGLAVQGVRWASRWATLWCVATIALYVLTVCDIFAARPSELTPNLLTSLAKDSSLGRAILLQAFGAAVVAVALRWTLFVRTMAIVLGIALAALAPTTLTGHAASSGGHSLATTSLLLHIVGVTLWVGGLAALAWIASRRSKRLNAAVRRFSVLAAWAFALVAVSGTVNAAVRLGSFNEVFGSDYGLLVVGKVALLLVLGVFGWRQRQRIIKKQLGFARLAVSELLVMAGAMGLGAALSRTPTPVGENVLTTRAEILLDGPMPPVPTAWRLVFSWNGNGVGLLIVGLGLALYLAGVVALRRRGDSWPIARTVSWFAGMLVVAWATIGGLGEYSHVMFSAHMATHMVLSMVAPILLILGAPMTLALRSLPGPRRPGEVSPRSLLLSFLHSRWSRFVTHPIVAPILFTGSLYALYFSPAFEAMMSNHWGHAVMDVHFLGVGFLYYYVLVGIDPSPRVLQPLLRFGLLLLTVPFHAFFAIAVMSSDTVMAGDYWRMLDRPYATDLLADQYLGGGIAWAMGEIPLILVMGAMFVQWIRSDAREARRKDRQAERDGDAELEAYNARLRDLAEHGRRRDP